MIFWLFQGWAKLEDIISLALRLTSGYNFTILLMLILPQTLNLTPNPVPKPKPNPSPNPNPDLRSVFNLKVSIRTFDEMSVRGSPRQPNNFSHLTSNQLERDSQNSPLQSAVSASLLHFENASKDGEAK